MLKMFLQEITKRYDEDINLKDITIENQKNEYEKKIGKLEMILEDVKFILVKKSELRSQGKSNLEVIVK